MTSGRPDDTTERDFAAPAFLDRLRRRDRAAMSAVIRAYLPQIYRAARGAGLPEQAAEDVAQATFTTFLEKIESFEGRSHVRTWIFGILYRKIAEERRSQQRDDGNEDISEVMEHRFSARGTWVRPPREADRDAFDAEVRHHIEECLEGLTTTQRMAFILREVENLASDEICNTLDVSRTNLGVLLYRGRNGLRECLEERSVRE